MKKLTTCLWFDGNAEAAVKFYKSVFKKMKVGKVARYDAATAKATGQKAGSVMTIEFEIEGQPFVALNGGCDFRFNESISFMVNCKTQAELDYYWKKLSAGGEEIQCGWLKDRFGVCWQIVPADWRKWVTGKNPVKRQRYMTAMMQMVKLDIKALKLAAEGK